MSVNSTVAYLLQNLNVHRIVLDNGLVILATENPAADIVSARLFTRAGSRYESAEQAGISHLLSAVLTKGTHHLSAQDIAERVESVGASLGADAVADYCLLSLKTVSADFAEILALAADLLRSPSFPESEVELERRIALQGIRSMQEQPFSVANRQLRQAMYGNHPYALPVLGTEASVSQLNRDDLQRYHQTYFRPDNLIISIAGRISAEESIALVDHLFGDWQAPKQPDGDRPLPLPMPKLSPIATVPQQMVTIQDTQQAIVMLGYLAAPVHTEDYVALKLLNTYLGNGLSSRLFVELREKRGLAYEVSAFYPTRLDVSQFVVYMGTAPTNAAIALTGLQQEVDRLCHSPLALEELQAAQNKLLGQYALGKQTNAQIAQTYGWYETLGLGVEFDQQFQKAAAAATAERLQQVACQYFTKPYISLVGPASVNEILAMPASS
ncbi:insulinase family protein [Oculatella sp. LEGE 06141]|uniref:M16 family metallopeptidase n=1 Tax=Oculatella sp. LEGE 06141 TaxID=1828648 RepID=UPI001881E978|nr:pitrilysin family protein [Oculatella sp. LEGE 06141]MBE9177194.1 insulinase family protein [Oculatella sp. LEGE 06141]